MSHLRHASPEPDPAPAGEQQTFSRWFTEWPSTHVRAGETVEVMAVAAHDAEMEALDESYRQALSEIDGLCAALERVAAPRRPDGTYNLSREACEQIAAKALAQRA